MICVTAKLKSIIDPVSGKARWFITYIGYFYSYHKNIMSNHLARMRTAIKGTRYNVHYIRVFRYFQLLFFSFSLEHTCKVSLIEFRKKEISWFSGPMLDGYSLTFRLL